MDEEKLERVYKFVYGNGEPGAKATIELIKSRLEDLNRKYEEILDMMKWTFRGMLVGLITLLVKLLFAIARNH